MAVSQHVAGSLPVPPLEPISVLSEIFLPETEGLHELSISPEGRVSSIETNSSSQPSSPVRNASTPFRARSLLVLPSLCHPHIHLDKPFLLTHAATRHLYPETGTFSEALSKTAAAKPLFKPDDLRVRMDTLLASSSRAGVTHCRAFAEVDATVGFISLDAALAAKQRWEGRMRLQICAFAQDPVFTGSQADENRSLMERAVQREDVEVLGSTPYVESDTTALHRNVEWAVRTAINAGKHLDFHLDYNTDTNIEPAVWFVLDTLRRERWVERAPNKTVCLGHCTRLTCFGPKEWKRLHQQVQGLPVYFVGLPTSDIFMMARPDVESNDKEDQLYAACCDRYRATLQVGAMSAAGFDVCLGINNVQNAFTPYGSADPLSLAQWGVGLYQAGTPAAAAALFDCVSRKAKMALGLLDDHHHLTSSSPTQNRKPGEVRLSDTADFVLIGRPDSDEGFAYHRRKHVHEVVWDAGPDRKTIFQGHLVRME